MSAAKKPSVPNGCGCLIEQPWPLPRDIERYYASLAELVEAGSTNNELKHQLGLPKTAWLPTAPPTGNELVPELAVARASLPTHCLTQKRYSTKVVASIKDAAENSGGDRVGEASAGWQNRSCWHQYETGTGPRPRMTRAASWTNSSPQLTAIGRFLETSPMDRSSASHQMLTLFQNRLMIEELTELGSR